MKNHKSWPVSQLIAHRGASAHAPENTIASLVKAHELGATWIECDVRLTLDNEVIVFHDSKLDRCTQSRGLVGRASYAVIADLEAGSWFDPKFAGEKIPTFDQWLQKAATFGCGIIIDLKAGWLEARKLADLVAVALARNWRSNLPRPIISSSRTACLRAMAAQKMDFDLAYIMKKPHRNWSKVVEQFHCLSVHLDHEFLSEMWLKQLKKLDVYLAAYTVNDPARAKQLFDWGIDSIFTDDPNLLNKDQH